MLDIKLIRDSPDLVRRNLERRNDHDKLVLLDSVIDFDERWKSSITELNQMRRRRNEVSMEIAELKRSGRQEEAEKKISEAEALPAKIAEKENQVEELSSLVRNGLMRIPNLLHESVPFGKDEKDNVEVKRWGKPPHFDFQPRDHFEVAQGLDLIDGERAAKVAGASFFYLKNELVLLDMALQRFTIDFLITRSFKPIEPPLMMKRKPYEGVTDLADFESVMYQIQGEDQYLIATSEHPMAAMFMDEVLLAEQMPLRFCGVSPCFRREVGSHGKYTKGLFRMHQFNKVEQFVFCLPEQSWQIHEELQDNSESLYQKLGLHYRVVNVCTGDIGIIAAKKYDTEFWMVDDTFREIGSNSNCTDYQARRLNIRYREKEGAPPIGFVHTLNNTAIATSRTMLAILEQYQQADGSVILPDALRPYMNGLGVLKK